MGNAIFIGAFNAQLYADACSAKSNYALAHPPTDGSTIQTCQFFNTYILYINKTSNVQGQSCAMYSESWDASYTTNLGQYRGADAFLIEYSFAYPNKTNPGKADPKAALYQARSDILWPGDSALPYCSSILGYAAPVAPTVSLTATVTLTTTVTLTATVHATSTAEVYVKRQDATPVPIVVTSGTAIMKALSSQTLAARGVFPTPDVLTKYPASIQTSACSLAVSSPSPLRAVTATLTATVGPISVTVIATQTIADVVTSTSTTSVPSATYPSIPCGQTLVESGFDFMPTCGVKYVPGGSVVSQTTSSFAVCCQNAGDNAVVFGLQYEVAFSNCTLYTYPILGGGSSSSDHYTTTPAPWFAFAYESDFLSAG